MAFAISPGPVLAFDQGGFAGLAFINQGDAAAGGLLHADAFLRRLLLAGVGIGQIYRRARIPLARPFRGNAGTARSAEGNRDL